MRMMIKRLLKRHKYPPEGMGDAVQTVMTQCELWADNNDMEDRYSDISYWRNAHVDEYCQVNKAAESGVEYNT